MCMWPIRTAWASILKGTRQSIHPSSFSFVSCPLLSMSATPRSPAPSASTSSPAHPTRSAPSANPLSPSSRSLLSPLPRYPPITLLSSDTSKIFAALYPVCLLIIYACCFSALVRHPNSLLLNTLCPVALLQCAYVVICLPPAGSRRAAADHATHATKESTSSVANPRLKAMKGLRKKGSHEDRAGNGKVAVCPPFFPASSLPLPLCRSSTDPMVNCIRQPSCHSFFPCSPAHLSSALFSFCSARR